MWFTSTQMDGWIIPGDMPGMGGFGSWNPFLPYESGGIANPPNWDWWDWWEWMNRPWDPPIVYVPGGGTPTFPIDVIAPPEPPPVEPPMPEPPAPPPLPPAQPPVVTPEPESDPDFGTIIWPIDVWGKFPPATSGSGGRGDVRTPVPTTPPPVAPPMDWPEAPVTDPEFGPIWFPIEGTAPMPRDQEGSPRGDRRTPLPPPPVVPPLPEPELPIPTLPPPALPPSPTPQTPGVSPPSGIMPNIPLTAGGGAPLAGAYAPLVGDPNKGMTLFMPQPKAKITPSLGQLLALFR